ncbi:TetR/AcrR family transcriptional regulator [Solirubrobacter taibaiensis]|nr:TetR/AcrR family transcriptional regulator [Solirubrobacter taibaiensis]
MLQLDDRHGGPPLRERQAAATRLQLLGAAQTLFERDGYASTSMAAIATAAGVSLKTVYLVFETKSGVLRALWHHLLRGDRDAVPVGEQPWFREVLDEPDPRRQLALNMRNSRVVKVRAGALLEVIQSAAAGDPAIGTLWHRIQTEFRANQRAVIQSLADKHALKPELDVEAAADILWSLNSPGLYRLLATERGWSPERYEQWMTDLQCAQLLAGHH